MNDSQIIAEVAKLKEQNKWIMGEMVELRKDVKSLIGFKFKVLGAGAVIGIFFHRIIGFFDK